MNSTYHPQYPLYAAVVDGRIEAVGPSSAACVAIHRRVRAEDMTRIVNVEIRRCSSAVYEHFFRREGEHYPQPLEPGEWFEPEGCDVVHLTSETPVACVVEVAEDVVNKQAAYLAALGGEHGEEQE